MADLQLLLTMEQQQDVRQREQQEQVQPVRPEHVTLLIQISTETQERTFRVRPEEPETQKS